MVITVIVVVIVMKKSGQNETEQCASGEMCIGYEWSGMVLWSCWTVGVGEDRPRVLIKNMFTTKSSLVLFNNKQFFLGIM